MRYKLPIICGATLAAIASFYQMILIPVEANTATRNSAISSATTNAQSTKELEGFFTFPVGINIGKQNINFGVLIRGKEDGIRAINFTNWLVPYDVVIKALKLNVTTLADGQLEMRSPGIVTRIDPRKLRNDPELGLVFSIAEIQKLFGVAATFDIAEYAIILDVPWANQTNNKIAQLEPPVILDGLPKFQPGKFSIAAAEQRVNASGSANSSTNFSGNFLAVGTIFDGSWFIRTNQPEFGSLQRWQLAEAQFLRQTNLADLFLGSQPTFWYSNNPGNYWGFTFIQRQGFTPPQNYYAGASDPRQRLQSGQVGRTIIGRTQPGSLVRLIEGLGEQIIGEILVDSSGIYRFENVKTETQGFNPNYRIFIYPEGRLTATPEIRDATASIVPGQIPAGASAWVASGGFRRGFADSLNPDFLGNFADFQGGIAGRWGVSENLTLGFGGVYDESLKGLAELFFRPNNFPFEVAVSALGGNDWDVISNVHYQPASNISATFSSDRLSNRLNINWNLFQGLSWFANTDSRNPTSFGFQVNYSTRNFFTFARVSLDTESNWRWNWLQRLGRLELNQRGNEIGTLSELSYNLSQSRALNLGHSLLASYDTWNQNSSDDLLTMGWRYRSASRASDGNYIWEAQLGYGMGSRGNGLVASMGTTILPGLLLRGRYQGVSLTSAESSFSVDLVSGLDLQGGVSPGDRRADYLRTQGGLLIKSFKDSNHNGKQDPGEEFYTDKAGVMLTINNKPLKSLRPEIEGDRTKIRLAPGNYRLDIDPAGFPPDWQAQTDALAVEVVAGSYTTVTIPLTQAYSFSGVVTDDQGNALAGARVEAVSVGTGKRSFSVTNTAGVYYLEGLPQGEYTILVNGKSNQNIKLDNTSEAYQELHLKQVDK